MSESDELETPDELHKSDELEKSDNIIKHEGGSRVKVPHGLENLLNLQQILIKQQIDFIEKTGSLQEVNKYCLFAPDGGMMYVAQQMKSQGCSRFNPRENRAFQMTIVDSDDKGLILEKPTNLFCSVYRSEGRPIFVIKTSVRIGICCGSSDIRFKIFSVKDSKFIGYIAQVWEGLEENEKMGDNFTVTFPQDLPVDLKALLLAGSILINNQLFEIHGIPRSNMY